MTGQYEVFLNHIMQVGKIKSDRTGTGTKSVFGYQMRFDLSEGFPLITTKKLHTKSIVGELLWMLRGETNVRSLQADGITIWDEWADENGELGPVYGAQWRSWPVCSDVEHPYSDGRVIDQIQNVIHDIKTNPDSRRLVVTAWNPSDLPAQKLPPCHMTFQFYVVDGKLSCQLYQRSADAFLGVPFNIASYALLTHIIARECGLEVGEFIWTGGDCHIYGNHIEQVTLQLSRTIPDFPTLAFVNGVQELDTYQIQDFEFADYHPHPGIKAPVAI